MLYLRLTIFALAATAAASAPAAAQQMNAEEFYQRALKLKKKGPMALFQRKEINALLEEVKGAGAAVKDRRLADEKEKGRGAYCPPKDKRGMTSDEYLAGLGSIPQSDRKRMTMTEAVTRMLATKFPCRG